MSADEQAPPGMSARTARCGANVPEDRRAEWFGLRAPDAVTALPEKGVMRVVVVGAGIIGAGVGRVLAGRGASVVIVDRQGPGAGTTSTSYAWINSNGEQAAPYFAFKAEAARRHRDMDPAGAWYRPVGHLEYAESDRHREHLARKVGRLTEAGYRVELLTADQARTREPDVRFAEGTEVALYPDEGYAVPMRFLGHLLEGAVADGAVLKPNTAVVSIETAGGTVRVTTRDEVLTADAVVLCTGRWTEDLADLLGYHVPLTDTTRQGSAALGFLAVTRPVLADIRSIITTEALNLRPDGGARLMLQGLDLDDRATPGDPEADYGDVISELLGRLGRRVPRAGDAAVAELMVGRRSLPLDELPITGFLDEGSRVYVAVAHSGLTLAPLLSECVADEVLGTPNDRLDGFRPARFEASRPRTEHAPVRMWNN